jgi:hypothetical protein
MAEIRRDPHINEDQKKTLIRIYESFRHENGDGEAVGAEDAPEGEADRTG